MDKQRKLMKSSFRDGEDYQHCLRVIEISSEVLEEERNYRGLTNLNNLLGAVRGEKGQDVAEEWKARVEDADKELVRFEKKYRLGENYHQERLQFLNRFHAAHSNLCYYLAREKPWGERQ